MHTIRKRLLSLLTVSLLSLSCHAVAQEAALDLNLEQANLANLSLISPNVIPPSADLNKSELLLTVGFDEEFDERPSSVSTAGFSEVLGWNATKTDNFREAAIDWFNERYGVDFSGGFYDPVSGTVITDFGILLPIRHKSYLRVLSSNKFSIPPYSILTPTSVGLALYVVVFFTPPSYTGTIANGGPAVAGNLTDTLAYGCYRVFLNYAGTKYHSIFMRSYYPSTEILPHVTGRFVTTDHLQLYSPEFGPGFTSINSVDPDMPNSEGKWVANARASWSFPGTFVPNVGWDDFTVAPVIP